MKRSYGISIFTGTLISIVISVSAIYMIMKSGMSVVLNTAVCSIVLLAVFRRQSAENAAISDIFARAAISVANLSAPYFAVIFLLGQEDAGSLVSFGAVIAVSGVFGVLFFAVLQKQAIQGEYPMLKPRIDLLAALKNSRTEKRKITLSMLAGAVFGVFKEGMPLLPKGWPLLDHPMFWLDNSLILVGTGYFIGPATYGKLALGSLYSLAVWLFFRAGSFQEHLMNPYIFSVTVGFALATGILTLGKIFYRQGRELLTGKRKLALNNSAVGVLAFYVAAALCFYGFFTDIPVWSLLLVLPFSVMLSLSTVKVIAETGFWVSNLDEVIPVLLIGITFFQNMGQITLFLTGVIAFEAAGIYFVLNRRVGESFGIPPKAVTLLGAASSVLGSILCVGVTYFIATSVGFQTASLPAPTSRVFAMTLEGLLQSIHQQILPPYINLYVAAAAGAVCLVLTYFRFSPMTLVAGMVLPFGIMLTVGVGALLRLVIGKRAESYRYLFSGSSIGEGLVTAAALVLAGIRGM